MPLGLREVVRRLGQHHATPATLTAIEANRHHFIELALWLDETLPDGREKDRVLYHVQAGLLWANTAVAYADRSGEPPPEPEALPGHYTA